MTFSGGALKALDISISNFDSAEAAERTHVEPESAERELTEVELVELIDEL